MEGISSVYSYLSDKPYGWGISGASIIKESIDSSFGTALLNAGWFGGLVYFLSFSYLLFFAIRFLFKKDIFLNMLGGMFCVYYISSLSRGLMDSFGPIFSMD